MSKSKKLTNRIIAVILIVLGLILGGTWNSACCKIYNFKGCLYAGI